MGAMGELIMVAQNAAATAPASNGRLMRKEGWDRITDAPRARPLRDAPAVGGASVSARTST